MHIIDHKSVNDIYVSDIRQRKLTLSIQCTYLCFITRFEKQLNKKQLNERTG